MVLHMFYDWPEWLLFAVVFSVISIAGEAGFRLGRTFAPDDPEAKKETSLIATAMLAVLGLLLGFSMSMAVSRFEMRKLLVIQEANALGTSYLRTQLLPEPNRTEVSNALRAYIDARIRCGDAGEDTVRLNSTRAEALWIQSRVWDQTVAYSRSNPNPVTSGLLLQSLNESIDLAETRWVALFNHVPESVLFVDVLTAVLSAILIGYELAGGRHAAIICYKRTNVDDCIDLGCNHRYGPALSRIHSDWAAAAARIAESVREATQLTRYPRVESGGPNSHALAPSPSKSIDPRKAGWALRCHASALLLHF